MEPKKRLGELLLEAGVIDETQLQSALGHQRRWGMKLGQALLDLKLATEPQVVAALSRKFGYEVANVQALQAGPLLEGAMRLVPREVAAKHTLLPVAADTNSITVAMADPTNIAVVDELSFRTGRRVKICIAGERELTAAVRKLYFGDEAKKAPEPIAFDETDVAIETTSDPYGALPDHLREGFVGQGGNAPPVAPVARRPPTPPPAPGSPPVVASPAFRPAPPPPVAAPPLPQPASYRTPPPPPPVAPFAAGRAAPEPFPQGAEVVDISDLAPAPTEPPLRPREAALAEAIGRLTRDAPPGGAGIRVAAALVRLLVRKGYFSEAEFLEELARR
jgi:type IV pilus assembly protein PilB